MRRFFVGAALALLVASPAFGGRQFLHADVAQINTLAAVQCVKDVSTNEGYEVLSCADNASIGEFFLPAFFPLDAGVSWTFRVHSETPAAVTGNCSWDIQAAALPGNTGLNSALMFAGQSGTSNGTATCSTAQERCVTGSIGPITLSNGGTGIACDNSCKFGYTAMVGVTLNATNTTASTCLFRMLEIIY